MLPSSVHEVLLVKEDHEVQPKDFRQMVNEVNCMAVEEAERLTNNAYHYDVKRNLLETVDEYQTRLEKEKVTKREQHYRSGKRKLDLCQYFEHKKLKGYADFFNSSSSFCCGVI